MGETQEMDDSGRVIMDTLKNSNGVVVLRITGVFQCWGCPREDLHNNYCHAAMLIMLLEALSVRHRRLIWGMIGVLSRCCSTVFLRWFHLSSVLRQIPLDFFINLFMRILFFFFISLSLSLSKTLLGHSK